MPFTCSICDQESTQICEYCTKDTCADHLCTGCLRCSDCCECDVPLTAQPNGLPVVPEETRLELPIGEAQPLEESQPREVAPQPEAPPLQEAVPEQDPAPEPGA